jgi:hypothetical protein
MACRQPARTEATLTLCRKSASFSWIRTRHVTQQRHTAKALQPPTAAPGTWMSGQAQLNASGTGGRCSPLPSLAYGTAYPQSERLLGSADLRISDDDLEYFVGPRGRDHRPVLVSPEVGERDSARRFQQVLVLRVNGRGDEDGEHCHGSRNDGKAGDAFSGRCVSLSSVLVVLASQILSQVQTWSILHHKKVF